MKRSLFSLLGAAGIGSALLLSAGSSWANGYDTGTVGTVSMSRGSAYLARADGPLATFYNPAALSRNGSMVGVSASLFSHKACLTRKTEGGGAVGFSSSDPVYDEHCNDNGIFPNPQMGASFRLSEKLGIGFAALGPSAPGKLDFPISTRVTENFQGTQVQSVRPNGGRFLLTELDSVIAWPQIGIGYEAAKNFRVGASFIWGIADLTLGNITNGLPADHALDPAIGRWVEGSVRDVRATINIKDYFVPGFVLSAMYTLDANIDIAAWFHWSDDVRGSGEADLRLFAHEDVNDGDNPVNHKTEAGKTTAVVPQPWDARLGFRYFKPRAGAKSKRTDGLSVKDPLHDEVFDVELDLTYSNDSQFDKLGMAFAPQQGPSKDGVTINLPDNADIPHEWQNAYGVRLGGSYNAIQDRLAIHAGGWFRTATSKPEYLHTDFVASQRIGVAGGVTGEVVDGLRISAGYSHIFANELDNGGNGQIRGISGSPATDASTPEPFRTRRAVNGGKLTAKTFVISLGVNYRFR